jgi:hypothetical protein
LRSMSNDSSKLRKRDPTLDISSEYCELSSSLNADAVRSIACPKGNKGFRPLSFGMHGRNGFSASCARSDLIGTLCRQGIMRHST